jgi:hypothetical protein
MRDPGSFRKWIWLAVSVQILGLLFDFLWHGLNPTFAASTVNAMARHLRTVHLVVYIGVASVLLTTTWATLDQMRHGNVSRVLRLAFTGAVISAVGEAWHAYVHLRLSTHSGPIAEAVSFLGLIIVIVALWRAGRDNRSGRHQSLRGAAKPSL